MTKFLPFATFEIHRMDNDLTSSTPSEAHSASFFAKYKFTLISLVVLILAIVPLAYLSRQQKKPAPVAQAPISLPTPTIVPFTSDNAQPTLDATDQSIQAGLQQSDTDAQTVSQINSSSDNVTGL